jgi:hypothetical protein
MVFVSGFVNEDADLMDLGIMPQTDVLLAMTDFSR